jgi:hypothetical protein
MSQQSTPSASSSDNASDSCKRKQPDKTESTGQSPDAKRLVMSRLPMPSDDATELEWNKTLFRKIEEMYENYDNLKRCLDFNNEELLRCKEQVSEMKRDITELQGQLNVVECEKEELKIQYNMPMESHIKTEIHMRQQNLVFEGIAETYGENSSLLYNKIVYVLNHMMVFNEQGSRVPITRVHRVGPYLKGKIVLLCVIFQGIAMWS